MLSANGVNLNWVMIGSQYNTALLVFFFLGGKSSARAVVV